MIRDIAPFIVFSAEILADRGVQHLKIFRKTVNACWVNFIIFIQSTGSRFGPRSQPDLILDLKEMLSVKNNFKNDSFSLATNILLINLGHPN